MNAKVNHVLMKSRTGHLHPELRVAPYALISNPPSMDDASLARAELALTLYTLCTTRDYEGKSRGITGRVLVLMLRAMELTMKSPVVLSLFQLEGLKGNDGNTWIELDTLKHLELNLVRANYTQTITSQCYSTDITSTTQNKSSQNTKEQNMSDNMLHKTTA